MQLIIRDLIYRSPLNQISLNANYPQSTLNKQINKETSMSLSTLLVLLDLFSELSAEWLLRGEGSMLKTVTSMIRQPLRMIK